MQRCSIKNILLVLNFLAVLFCCRADCSEETFFRTHFDLSNYFKENHVTMSQMKISESYALSLVGSVNNESALSALKGLDFERELKMGKDESEKIEMKEWNELNQEEFFRSERNEVEEIENIKETGNKGLPDPYFINNITDDMRHIKLYLNNDELENTELIYKGNYIPKVYKNFLLIFIITLAYILSIRTLVEGYIFGKNTAKTFLPVASSLFVFLFILKMCLMILPVTLSIILCVVLTLNYYRISLDKFDPFDLLKNNKIERQPIGWFLTIFSVSLIIANILYHLICNIKVLNYVLLFTSSSVCWFFLYIASLILLSSIIFLFISANILPAKKTQNMVFSLFSSYLLLSAYTYAHNLVKLQYFRNTDIFQIEPIMFFSYKPKFVFNNMNTMAIVLLTLMTLISVMIPKWVKKMNSTMKLKKKNLDTTMAKYDMFLNIWT